VNQDIAIEVAKQAILDGVTEHKEDANVMDLIKAQ